MWLAALHRRAVSGGLTCAEGRHLDQRLSPWRVATDSREGLSECTCDYEALAFPFLITGGMTRH